MNGIKTTAFEVSEPTLCSDSDSCVNLFKEDYIKQNEAGSNSQER